VWSAPPNHSGKREILIGNGVDKGAVRGFGGRFEPLVPFPLGERVDRVIGPSGRRPVLPDGHRGVRKEARPFQTG